jgi:hypothetical protein
MPRRLSSGRNSHLTGVTSLLQLDRFAPDGASTPIIFNPGYVDIPMTVRTMKAGAVEFLTKPLRDDALLNAVERAPQASSAVLCREVDPGRSGSERAGHPGSAACGRPMAATVAPFIGAARARTVRTTRSEDASAASSPAPASGLRRRHPSSSAIRVKRRRSQNAGDTSSRVGSRQ